MNSLITERNVKQMVATAIATQAGLQKLETWLKANKTSAAFPDGLLILESSIKNMDTIQELAKAVQGSVEESDMSLHQVAQKPSDVLELYATQFQQFKIRVCLFQIPDGVPRNAAQFSYYNQFTDAVNFTLREEVCTAPNEPEVIMFLVHRLQGELRQKQDIGHPCRQLVIGVRNMPEYKHNTWMAECGYAFLPNLGPVYLQFANRNIEPTIINFHHMGG